MGVVSQLATHGSHVSDMHVDHMSWDTHLLQAQTVRWNKPPMEDI